MHTYKSAKGEKEQQARWMKTDGMWVPWFVWLPSTTRHHEHEDNNSSVTQNLRGWNLNGWKHHHISRWKPKLDKLSAVDDGGGRKAACVFFCICVFLFFADYVGQHNYMAISSFKSAWCLELSGYSLFLVCVRYFRCGLEDVCYEVHETNSIWRSKSIEHA